jgi:hypothetical protein
MYVYLYECCLIRRRYAASLHTTKFVYRPTICRRLEHIYHRIKFHMPPCNIYSAIVIKLKIGLFRTVPSHVVIFITTLELFLDSKIFVIIQILLSALHDVYLPTVFTYSIL